MTNQVKVALALIHSGMTVSIGGGRHMLMLAEAIASADLSAITLCSPAEATRAALKQQGIPATPWAPEIDIAFDGCDSVDQRFRALKTNGGIFTDEKQNAWLAKRFVLLTGTDKYRETLDADVALTLEAGAGAWPLIQALAAQVGVSAQIREASNYMGHTRTHAGNLLIDLRAADWREIQTVDAAFTQIPGVVATSLFSGLVTDLLLEATDGDVTHLHR